MIAFLLDTLIGYIIGKKISGWFAVIIVAFISGIIISFSIAIILDTFTSKGFISRQVIAGNMLINGFIVNPLIIIIVSFFFRKDSSQTIEQDAAISNPEDELDDYINEIVYSDNGNAIALTVASIIRDGYDIDSFVAIANERVDWGTAKQIEAKIMRVINHAEELAAKSGCQHLEFRSHSKT